MHPAPPPRDVGTTLPQMFDLRGTAAFVTGAGRGLGEAIAQGLAEAGSRVVLADIDPAVDAAASRLQSRGLECAAVHLDVRDEAAFDAVFAAACDRLGGIDIMVNNAAVTSSTPLWSISVDEWDEVLAVNLRGTFLGCRIAGRHMRVRGAGRIVNLSSIAGQQPSAASGAHYAASKAGILALTRTFAAEMAPHGVTVNALAPSAVSGPLLDGLDEERRRAVAAAIPLSRFGESQEVAAAVVYLASPAAAFITGATLDLNGGRLMR
jgi:3-oxoacyl-[acyl-carrier protein] reductase